MKLFPLLAVGLLTITTPAMAVERSLTSQQLNEIHQGCVKEVYGNPALYGGDPSKGYEDYSLIPVVKDCEQFVQQRMMGR